jgi:cell division protein ZapA
MKDKMKSDLSDPTPAQNQNSSTDKQVFEVVVAGLPLKLKTSHNQETVTELVQFVDKKIQEAVGATKNGFPTAAVLACLNLAEELILLKRKALTEIDRLEIKTRRVITELESSQEATAGLDH